MANSEALRDLQTRLAERLQAAKTDATRIASWLAVESAGQGLLFPLAGAGEIFSVPALLTVPHTTPWFVGVANLRGSLHGVVDMAAFLGLRAPRGAGDPVRPGSRLLALNANLGSHCALLVDGLAGLRNEEQLQPEADADVARPAFAGARWRDHSGRDWQEIDLVALATHPQFLAIAN